MNFRKRAKELVAQMTVEEKASLCSGKNFWYLKGITRLGLPEVMVTDGPHGLRKQETSADNLGLNQSLPSTCFPTASATACSFDRDLLSEMGQAIAEECQAENVAVVLGPGINIKRSPLCGRNFEYFSEDPVLSGELAAAMINGVQKLNVGVSLKHYAANNQEKRRMVIESVIDERTCREIYLKGFEIAVKKSQPWTVMCSYNKLFGEYASQNERLLTQILRKEWGFEGAVISDWGATVERVKGLRAGMDIEMPHLGDVNDRRIAQAVQTGTLSPAILDQAAERVTELILRSAQRQSRPYEQPAHHALARRIAAQSAVLLKNEHHLLPGTASARTAIIGALAKKPRYQGTGSSKIQPNQLDNAYDELCALGLQPEYAEGYSLESDAVIQAQIDQACDVAKGKEMVYLFAGLPDRYESETFDRDKMSLPENQNRLIHAVSQVNPHVAVILLGGSPMELPWADQVGAILLLYLGGEAGGGACADLLLGRANPCGKLAESWPLKTEDNPSFAHFPGYGLTVEYREGLFVGYRYYDTARKAVAYPFGYGLSYTQFEYSDLKISSPSLTDSGSITLICTIKNTGSVPGKEIVQFYTSCQQSSIVRPAQELKGFTKVSLEPGQSQEVTFTLSTADLAVYNPQKACWTVENAAYELRVGASSRDIQLTGQVNVQSTSNSLHPHLATQFPAYADLSNGIHVSDAEYGRLLGYPIPPREREKNAPHTINSTFSDIQNKWLGRQLMGLIRKQIDSMSKDNPDMKVMAEKMLMDSPLRFITMMGANITIAHIEGLVDLLNGHFFSGLKKMIQNK